MLNFDGTAISMGYAIGKILYLNNSKKSIPKYTITDIEKENGYKKVTVENKKGATLPTAGGMGTALFVACGLIIMLGAATGVYVIRRKTVKER